MQLNRALLALALLAAQRERLLHAARHVDRRQVNVRFGNDVVGQHALRINTDTATTTITQHKTTTTTQHKTTTTTQYKTITTTKEVKRSHVLLLIC